MDYERLLKDSAKSMELSQNELSNLSKAFKNENFKADFSKYLAELADPKTRLETGKIYIKLCNAI